LAAAHSAVTTLSSAAVRAYLKRRSVPIGAGLALVAAALALFVIPNPFSARVEDIAYDLRVRATLPSHHDDRIVIVDIDDASLAREGRWQWPRDRLARMVDNLFKHGAAVVAFDVMFTEPDESSGLKVLQGLAHGALASDSSFRRALSSLAPTLDNDRIFADSMRHGPVVLSYFFNDRQSRSTSSGAPPPPLPVITDLSNRHLDLPVAYSYGGNIPVLQDAASGAGFATVDLDPDGVLRRVPMLYRYNGQIYPSLALEVARVYLGAKFVQVSVHRLWRGSDGIDRLIVDGHEVPTDKDGRALVPYLGPWKSFPYVSAADAVEDRISNRQISGKIVLVGSTATGLFDLRSTPVASQYPGVEVHANIISGILDKKIGSSGARRFYQIPIWAPGANVLVLLVLGTTLALVLPGLALEPALAVTLVASALLVGFNMLLWFDEIVLALATPLLLVTTLFVMNIAYGYVFESRGRRKLMGVFGQYVPPELVDEMSRREESFGLEGDSREMTVLFCDIRGFTALSESLSPSELKELLNRFFTPMTRIIHAHRGTIDKYVGDMIMAFWGAPLRDPDHARLALEAALEMGAMEAVLQAEFARLHLPLVEIGMGINTGVMNVGNMGSEFRMAYTVIGDAVNLASRMEGLTRVYGVRLIVSDVTRAAHGGLVYRELDRVRVKGKNTQVAIYEPLGRPGHLDAELLKEVELYEDALRLYRAGNWDLAELRFLALRERYPRKTLYNLFIGRIQHFRRTPPPPDWQGVSDHLSK